MASKHFLFYTNLWHIAAWVVSFGILARLAGNSKRIISPFVRFLQCVFQCEIDVQVGNGRLNYINGYVSKDHDSLDVGLGEYVQKSATAPWSCFFTIWILIWDFRILNSEF